MKGRKPTADELSLWKQANKQTEIYTHRAEEEPKELPTSLIPKKVSPISTIPARLPGPLYQPKVERIPDISEHLTAQTPAMDRKRFTQLKRGQLRPEAKLDLHGMTQERAHGALARFISSAQSSGKRLVLVVTGKGKDRDAGGPIPVRRGVLRHTVPEWLSMPPLSAHVLQIATAHRKHGGEGAYYVYLRRSRA